MRRATVDLIVDIERLRQRLTNLRSEHASLVQTTRAAMDRSKLLIAQAKSHQAERVLGLPFKAEPLPSASRSAST